MWNPQRRKALLQLAGWLEVIDEAGGITSDACGFEVQDDIDALTRTLEEWREERMVRMVRQMLGR